MEIQQHPNLQQHQTQLPFLIQRMEILQLSRMDVAHYLSQYIDANPLMLFDNEDDVLLGGSDLSEGVNLEEINEATPTLFEFIIEQIELFYRQTPLRDMTMWWVRQLNTDGYVTKSIDEAVRETGQTEVMVKDGLTLLQQLDPPGIGASSLRENFMLQTERLDHAPDLAYIILEEHFEALVERQWTYLAGIYNTTVQAIQEVLSFIQTLAPIPATLYTPSRSEQVYPELEVTIQEQEIHINETRFKTPLLVFDQAYYEELKALGQPQVGVYITEKKREFNQLQSALKKRKDTILRVGTAILFHQRAYFLERHTDLRPLQINDLVEALQLHESTISRAIRETYVQTPRGVMELKTLLSKRSVVVNTSQDAILNRLQQLIASEDQMKPLSDQQLAELLAQDEMPISRRTVAKYRRLLGIGSTRDRKIR